MPPVSSNVSGVRVHFCGWPILSDEIIPKNELSTRIRPRRTSTLYGPGGPEDEDQVRCMYNSRLPMKRVEEDNEYEAVVPGGFGGMYVPAVTLYDQL